MGDMHFHSFVPALAASQLIILYCIVQHISFGNFLDLLYLFADSFGKVAYMVVGMMVKDLVFFAMLLLNFCYKVDFVL